MFQKYILSWNKTPKKILKLTKKFILDTNKTHEYDDHLLILCFKAYQHHHFCLNFCLQAQAQNLFFKKCFTLLRHV